MEVEFGKAPATRWDRLVAVLEEVDPERVIDARHIIERARRQNVSDLELFYILGIRYQSATQDKLLSAVLNLYILMSTWVEWLKSVDACLRARRLGSPCNVPSCSSAEQSAHNLLCPSRQTLSRLVSEQLDTSVSTTTGTTSPLRSSTALPLDNLQRASAYAAQWSAPSTPHNDASRESRTFRAQRPSGSTKTHVGGRRHSTDSKVFDLGAGWSWEGTLDFLRDGVLLSKLVQEALSYKKISSTSVPTTSVPADAYSHRFPSLADMDRVSGLYQESPTVFSTISNGLYSHVRGRCRKSALDIIENQGKTVAEAERAVQLLNQLCERFLGWDVDANDDHRFLEVHSGDRLMNPLNEDDVYLLNRLHWLGVALFHEVQDPSIIPVPPRVSFLMLHETPRILVDTLDEDNDLAIQIATKLSCLPHNHKLSIIARENVLLLSHPVAQPEPIPFECCVVEGEAFAYVPKVGGFVALWSVLQYFLRTWDNIHWIFEMSALEEKSDQLLMTSVYSHPTREVKDVLSPTSATRTKGRAPVRTTGQHIDPTASTTFDLTVQSSISRRCQRGAGGVELAPTQSASFMEPTRDATAKHAPRRFSTTDDESNSSPMFSGCIPIVPLHDSAPLLPDADAPVVESSLLRVTPPLRQADAVGELDPVASCTLSVSRRREAALPPLVVTLHQQSSGDYEDGLGPGRPDGGGSADPFHEEPITPLQYAPDSNTMFYSECSKVVNFSATVVHESKDTGIAIKQHQFRVSGRPVGKGAFGAVYRALDLESGMIVAVKQSRLSFGHEDSDLNWREFQTWSMLPSHPNVITFHGASKEVETHQLLLVMEYASGGSILKLYRNFHPIPEHLFFFHARGIALGLKHLHDHNVIHGDVKPENVLTRSDGSVAITDFGCSRLPLLGGAQTSSDGSSAERNTDSSNNDGSGSWRLFGTAAYMSPEVITNEPDFKSDVWAYACTLVHLWLGDTPWSGCSRTAEINDSIPLMFCIAKEDVVPYSPDQLACTPRWVQRIAQRSFERDVEKRCNMAEVLTIITEYHPA